MVQQGIPRIATYTRVQNSDKKSTINGVYIKEPPIDGTYY